MSMTSFSGIVGAFIAGFGAFWAALIVLKNFPNFPQPLQTFNAAPSMLATMVASLLPQMSHCMAARSAYSFLMISTRVEAITRYLNIISFNIIMEKIPLFILVLFIFGCSQTIQVALPLDSEKEAVEYSKQFLTGQGYVRSDASRSYDMEKEFSNASESWSAADFIDGKGDI